MMKFFSRFMKLDQTAFFAGGGGPVQKKVVFSLKKSDKPQVKPILNLDNQWFVFVF